MYSIVLMAAIGSGSGASGADQPAVVVSSPSVVVVGSGCTGCTGCYGCTGYVASYGCCGGRGGLFHRHGCCGGFLGHKHSCHGCCGGYSCFGSCSGYAAGCWGSCTGYGYSSAYGAGYSGFSGIPYYYPTYPQYSTPVPTGANPYYYPGNIRPVPPAVVVPEAKPEVKKTSANLKFNLPAGAVLFVDGQKTPGEGAERSFFTPPLEAGQKYFYDVRAEIAIGGKTFVEEKRVVVEPGAELNESFPKMVAALAAPSTVAVK